MASFTMFPPTLPCQQQRLQQQQPTQLPLSCQTASTRACPSKSRLSLQTCEQSPPVRISSRTPLPTSHAYNLRSCPSFSPLSPSPSSSPTDASIHTPPPLSTLFSFSTDDDLLHNSFSYQDPTLKPPQANALGVQFNNPEQYNPTDFSLNWYGLPSDSPNPIQGLLNSDIYAKNNTAAAHHQSAHSFSSTPAPVVQQGSDDNYNDTDNSGQSTTNPIENTIFQQLQGFNLSNHLLNKKSKNMPSSTSSPQTPRDGTALYSSFGPSVTSGGAGMTKSAADFDFDMLAASFLNDQVAAFDSTSLASLAPATSNNNTNNSSKNITESFFANLPLIGSPVNFTSNLTSTSPPLQNAFRSFSSNAVNTMLPAQQLPRHNSSSSSSSVSSPALASPAFDASSAFPFGGLGASNNSPNFSGIDTPALVPDDGNDLAASLTTSPMWGQLDLGSISLFPQQQQTQTQSTITAPLQQQPSLPTISPKELSLPLPDKTFNNSNQVRPASSVAINNNKANKKRVRESPAFGSDGEDEDEEEDEATQRQAQTTKKSRRSTSTSTSSAPQNHFTGTRHSASAALLPLDAPTQPRTYYGPESKTSKRAVPAAAARKVAAIKAQAEMMKRARRSVSSAAPAAAEEAEANAEVEDDDSGSLEGEVKEVIEMTIEQKRRQNTIAARRSRARKAEHLASLEESIRTLTERVNLLENEKMVWMMRAMAAGWTEDSRSNLVNLS